MAGHAPGSGPLHHRRRPDARTPGSLGAAPPGGCDLDPRRPTNNKRPDSPLPSQCPPSLRASGKVKGGGEARKEGRKEGRRSRSPSLEVRGRDPSPEPGPGRCARPSAAARRPRPCSAVGRQEPRRPAVPGSPLLGRAGIEIKASRIKRSPPARPPPHLQLARRRTPIRPSTLTWSWHPAPAWREDPRPARGEGVGWG